MTDKRQAALEAVAYIELSERSRIDNMCNNEYPYHGLDGQEMLKKSKVLKACGTIRDALTEEASDDMA